MWSFQYSFSCSTVGSRLSERCTDCSYFNFRWKCFIRVNNQNLHANGWASLTVWIETLAPGKFGEFGECSWICQILNVQIFCYYKFSWQFPLQLVRHHTRVAGGRTANNSFFLCCHCFWIMGIPDLPHSSELSSSHLSPPQSSPLPKDLHWPSWVSPWLSTS